MLTAGTLLGSGDGAVETPLRGAQGDPGARSPLSSKAHSLSPISPPKGITSVTPQKRTRQEEGQPVDIKRDKVQSVVL